MRLKATSILALVCLSLLHSDFAADTSIPPGAGGEAIQAALDGLPAGGEIVLSEGKYVIHTPIRLRHDGQSLRGCGTNTVLYLADGANCPVVVLGSLSATAKNPTKGVHLANLLIDGNRGHQQREVWWLLPGGAGVYNNGVDVWGTTDATVEGVVCCHCRSAGMTVAAGTRRLTVRDYTAFDNQFDGLACYQTEESHFSHLNLHDNPAAGISLDLDFNRNDISDAILTNNDLGIFMRQSRSNLFEGVTISQSRHHGVFMAETAVQTSKGWLLSPGSECIGNIFSNLIVSHCAGKAFLVNDAGCSHNTIYNGRFSDNTQGGLSEPVANLVTMRSAGEVSQATLPAKSIRTLGN